MKPIAEIPPRPRDRVRAGTLRRSDLEAFQGLLEEVGTGVVLVTGAGEGRLVVSTGLATAAAAGGRRTALVECDLEKPSLAEALGLAPSPGLADYLRRESEAAEIVQPLVLAGPGSGPATDPLVCVVAGDVEEEDGRDEARQGDGSPPAVASDGFRHALAKLRTGYPLVVLHGPPLGDRSGALHAAAEQSGAALACFGSSLLSGIAGRRLRRAIGGLPAPRTEVVAYG